MSRLPATSAENLANELHRQLELVEFERDEAIRERDEAQAVIDGVRFVRDWVKGMAGNPSLGWRWEIQHQVFAWVLRRLDGVDGL